MFQKIKNKKVLIGMSGGVDSSISAYILKDQGYSVEGMTIKTCNNDLKDSELISKSLNIPFHIVDMEKEFTKNVIEYFINTYKEGKTPNPCVICNRYIKFQALLNKAKELNIQYISTGHYAQVKYNIFKKRYVLKKAKDKSKDQTYALYNLTQEQLSRCIFPLGIYTKKNIRNIARSLNMKVADKEDSQDVCFSVDIKDNIGNIIDLEGNVLGKHKGISKYTIGQRKGIEISSKYPYYVVDIDPNNNVIIVGNEDNIYKNELVASFTNWISIENLNKEMMVNVKIRYGAKEVKAKISPMDNGNVHVKFFEKQRAITPGQAVVFYKGNTVVGGGLIV